MNAHNMNLNDLNIDNTWTLFLDRDGVINKRIIDDYVKTWNQFEFLPGVVDAIKKFSALFGKIVVVTNQQGIGKGIMRNEDLEQLHKNMLYEVTYFKGRIDKIYFCPNLASENHPDRKPGIGMALKAKNDFPEVDFEKSIMIGDSVSDIEFGKNCGMKTIYISNQKLQLADFTFLSLEEVANELTK
jgi:D-glycero-D-manno-heptose 1,7-bisphosphate phosphatase